MSPSTRDDLFADIREGAVATYGERLVALVTTNDLATGYHRGCCDRLAALAVLHARAAFSDVVREIQEDVELALKGMLRWAGIDPPKIHDVGDLVLRFAERFEGVSDHELAAPAEASKELRKPTRRWGRRDSPRRASRVDAHPYGGSRKGAPFHSVLSDVTLAVLAGMVVKVTGFVGMIVFDGSKPDGTMRKLMNVSRLTDMGWQACIGVEEGLAGTYAWYCSQSGVRK